MKIPSHLEQFGWYPQHQAWLAQRGYDHHEHRGASAYRAVISDADFRCADMADAFLRGAVFMRADLTDSNMRGADLSGVDLTHSDMRGADLSGAVMADANMRGADLSGAVMINADLTDADMSEARLRGADMRGADLSGVLFRDANLRRVDLRGAKGVATRDECIARLDAIRDHVIENGDPFSMSDWHDREWSADTKPVNACRTSHCLAGWAQALCYDRSMREIDPITAGVRLIPLAVPLFWSSNHEAKTWLENRDYAA